MTVLLDTNVFVWAAAIPERLSARALATVADAGERRFISPLSTYEIAQKIAVGKLDVGGPAIEFVSAASRLLAVEWLSVTERHLRAVDSIAWTHRDPFDRLLALQAMVEGIHIVSPDRQFEAMGIERIW